MKNILNLIIPQVQNKEFVYRRIEHRYLKNNKLSTAAFKDKRGNLSVSRSLNRKEEKIISAEKSIHLKGLRKRNNSDKFKLVALAKCSVEKIRDKNIYVTKDPILKNIYHANIRNSIEDEFLSEINIHELTNIFKVLSIDN